MKKSQERLLVYGIGTIFLISLMGIAAVLKEPTRFQYEVYKVILAIEAAGVAALIPGFINFDINKTIRAGGAIAVFAIIYFNTPADFLIDPPQSNVSISTARYLEEDPDKLDIVLKNIGNQTAFIDNATFHVEEIYKLEPNMMRFYSVISSEEYKVEIPNKKTPFTVSLPLHQGIDADSLDRFSILIDTQTSEDLNEYVYEFFIRFNYDSKAVDSKKFFYMPLNSSRYFSPPFDITLQSLSKISEKNGIKSVKLENLIKEFVSS